MQYREATGEQGAQAATYKVTLTIDISDVEALWAAAAERAMAAPGMTLGDILDTIGPREDPMIAECIAMLAAPRPIAGCQLEAFDVRPAVGNATADLIQLPLGDAGRPAFMPAANG